MVRIVPESLNKKQMALRCEGFTQCAEFRFGNYTARWVGKRRSLERYSGEEVWSCLRDGNDFALLAWKFWAGDVEDNSRKTREQCCLAVSSRLHMITAGLDQNRRPPRTKNRPIHILTGGIQRCLRLTDSQDHPPLPDNTIDKQLAGLEPFG